MFKQSSNFKVGWLFCFWAIEFWTNLSFPLCYGNSWNIELDFLFLPSKPKALLVESLLCEDIILVEKNLCSSLYTTCIIFYTHVQTICKNLWSLLFYKLWPCYPNIFEIHSLYYTPLNTKNILEINIWLDNPNDIFQQVS